MSSDGAQLFLTSYDPYRSGEIYTTELNNGQWSELRKLNKHINTVFNESHASLSSNGKYLYFTSDRKGGFGGLDIYRSARDNSGDWGPPVNMGPLINSPYNEESPFESSDAGKLYFSSQGHYNMGGYDVFFSEANEDSSWLPPLNLGYPLNTTDDDLFFFPLGDGHVGYQARYSPLNGRMDIIRLTISKFGDPARFMVNGKVDLHASPDYDPANVSVTFIDKIAADTVAIKHLNEDGTFRQKLRGGTYALFFQDETLSLLTKELYIPDYFPHNNLVFHEELTIPSRILSDTLFIRNIRFAFNKSGFSEDYCPFLDGIAEALIRYPDVKLNVNGYADALGGSNYNLKLSMLRANSVAEYIKSKLPLPAKISVEAYGELNPVAVNSNPDGTDNIIGRSFNRRVEIVLSNLPGHVVVIPVNEVPEMMRQK
jgi:outer membrane protein OmpA-like peptidoglycan-associated protein